MIHCISMRRSAAPQTFCQHQVWMACWHTQPRHTTCKETGNKKDIRDPKVRIKWKPSQIINTCSLTYETLLEFKYFHESLQPIPIKLHKLQTSFSAGELSCTVYYLIGLIFKRSILLPGICIVLWHFNLVQNLVLFCCFANFVMCVA